MNEGAVSGGGGWSPGGDSDLDALKSTGAKACLLHVVAVALVVVAVEVAAEDCLVTWLR